MKYKNPFLYSMVGFEISWEQLKIDLNFMTPSNHIQIITNIIGVVSELPIRLKQQKISKTPIPPFRGIFPKTNQQIGVFINAM